MASNAATTTPGRMARVIHWLFPSRQQFTISLAADVGLALLGLPLWTHVVLGVVLHFVLHAQLIATAAGGTRFSSLNPWSM